MAPRGNPDAKRKTERRVIREGNADARPSTMRREAIKVASMSVRQKLARPRRLSLSSLVVRRRHTHRPLRHSHQPGRAHNAMPPPPLDPGRVHHREAATCVCGKMAVAPHDSAFSEILKQISDTGWQPCLKELKDKGRWGVVEKS
ncbi:hypothetical protein MRX96_015128 [Rhipicephalus microplus]